MLKTYEASTTLLKNYRYEARIYENFSLEC